MLRGTTIRYGLTGARRSPNSRNAPVSSAIATITPMITTAEAITAIKVGSPLSSIYSSSLGYHGNYDCHNQGVDGNSLSKGDSQYHVGHDGASCLRVSPERLHGAKAQYPNPNPGPRGTNPLCQPCR